VGKNVAWPYDLIIGPLKGKLRATETSTPESASMRCWAGSSSTPRLASLHDDAHL